MGALFESGEALEQSRRVRRRDIFYDHSHLNVGGRAICHSRILDLEHESCMRGIGPRRNNCGCLRFVGCGDAPGEPEPGSRGILRDPTALYACELSLSESGPRDKTLDRVRANRPWIGRKLAGG